MGKPKIKAGTAMSYNGQMVYVERDRQNGLVNVCFQETRAIHDTYEVVAAEALKPINTGRSTISNKPKPQTEKQKTDTQLANEFFDRVGLRVPYNCNECGKPLYAFTKVAKRSVCAHILPKAHFESVKYDTDNIMYLGADFIGCPCNCHDRYDASVEIRVTMKVYDHALKQFYKMKHKLTPEEIKRAYTYLNIQWQ